MMLFAGYPAHHPPKAKNAAATANAATQTKRPGRFRVNSRVTPILRTDSGRSISLSSLTARKRGDGRGTTFLDMGHIIFGILAFLGQEAEA